jgi:hypothetical protein
MPFNGFNMLKTPPKKAGGIPSITFSNPSLVTTTTHWVVDASYRVFLLEGTNLSNNSQLQVDATLNNWSSNINIYFLVVGAGGPGGKKNTHGGGAGGGGGFLDGSANIPGTPGIKTMSFLLPSKNELGNLGGGSQSKAAEITVKNNATTPITYLYAAAGGGGNGGVHLTHGGQSGSIPPGTGVVTKKIQGNGGGGAHRVNGDDEYRYAGSALNRGGPGEGPYFGYGGPGGGSGGSGGSDGDNTPGIGSSVSSTTLGIKQRFGNAIFCAGGKGAAGNTEGVDGIGIYGSGGGGSVTSNYRSGQKGIIAIAINVNDVPPEIII